MILSVAQATTYAAQAGFSGSGLSIIVAIAQAESGLDTNTKNTSGNSAGTDRGILQINSYYHPEVSDAQAYDPAQAFVAAFRISSGGRDFSSWTTYQNGQYRAYLGSNSGKYQQGTRNIYASYLGQCTYWAAERYHELSNVWVPWAGNANQWLAGAQSAGWQAVPNAPKSLPSIICLQPFAGQGANSLYGHVGVVESVNSDGSVVTSDMNWSDPNAPVLQSIQGFPIKKVVFTPGPGVSFLYASASAGSQNPNLIQAVVTALMGGGGFANVNSSPAAALVSSITLAPNASVTEFLVAMDQILTLINPFDIPLQTDSIAGVSFTDPVSWLAGLGQNLFADSVALAMRLVLLLLALFLFYRIINNFLDVNAAVATSTQAIGSAAKTLGPLLA